MQSEDVYFQGVEYSEAESAIEKILADIDAGICDEELKNSGIERDRNISLSSRTTLQQPQGMSPDQWYVITAVVAPAVSYSTKSVWDKIVIPKLKRLLRADRVSRQNPKKRLK
jgi:hypothetical protein